MKKLLLLVLSAVLAFSLFAFTGCEKKYEHLITVPADYQTEGKTLLDYMNSLKESGELEFETAGSLDTFDFKIKSIAGKETGLNDMWVLYTDDSANYGNEAEYKYKSKTYKVASTKAEYLTLKAGASYLWVLEEINMAAITVSLDVMTVTAETTLIDYMNALKEKGDLSFSGSDTQHGVMIDEINGKKSSFNRYWLLYTDDLEMSNSEWGTVTYEGKSYGSAAAGASILIIKEGCTYIWALQ